MAGYQYFIVARSLDEIFTITQATLRQGGIDANLVLSVAQTEKLIVAQTKAPGFLVIRRAIGNQVWLVGQREEMLLEFAPWQFFSDRHAISDDMQVGLLEIDDLSFRIDLAYVPTSDNLIWFRLSGAGQL